MKRNRIDTFQVASEGNGAWFGKAVVSSCAALLLLHLIGSFFPKERLWGINYLAYFSPYFTIVITIGGLLVLVPQINHWLQNNLKKLMNFIYGLTIQRHKYLYFVIFSFLSIVVFWLLRVKTALLGDGYYLVTSLPAGEMIRKWEPLEMAIHLHLYKFFKGWVTVDPITIYAVVSYFAGAVFVFFSILIADLLGKGKFDKVLVLSLLVSMGSILLFLGYAEHYSLTCSSILAYFYFALRYVKKGGNILPVTLAFIISGLLHLLALSLFPSLLFLYSLSSDVKTGELHISKKRAFLFLAFTLFILVGGCVYVLEYGKLSSLSNITVSLTGRSSRPYYTLFSTSHLLDVVNEQLLVSPIGFILLFSLIMFYSNKIEFKDKVFQFLSVVILFQLAFHFLVNPNLGAIRDWDLFSFTALGYTMLGIYLFLKLVQNKHQIRYVGTVLVFTSLLSTLPWVMLNANTQKSLQRTISALELDPGNCSFYQYIEEYLKKSEKSSAEESKKIEELFKTHFPLFWITRRGEEQIKRGNLEEAEAIFKQGVQIFPQIPSTHYNLACLYMRTGKRDDAMFEFEKAIQLSPKDAFVFDSYAELGAIYLSKKQFDKAMEMLKKAITGEVSKKEVVYQNLGYCCLFKNKLDEAISMYQEALKLNPNLAKPHMYLGHSYLRMGKKDKAIDEYKLYLKRAGESKEVEEIKALISKLNKQ